MAIFDKTEFLQRVEKIVVPAYHSLLFYLKDGKVIKQPWKSTALKDMWTEKRKEQVQQRMVQYRKVDCPAVIVPFQNVSFARLVM